MNDAAAIGALALEPPFALEDVKRAFRSAALAVHPDLGGTDVAMRVAIEARDHLISTLKRNPAAFARPKPKPVAWHRSAKGNLTTQMPKGEWLTVFKTTRSTFKWVCAGEFSPREWITEEAAVEAAVERWA